MVILKEPLIFLFFRKKETKTDRKELTNTFKDKHNVSKLIAWNFATTVVHQPVNRKFPRRCLAQNGEPLRADHKPLRKMI